VTDPLACFREVWVVDFEFHAPAGERPEPLCMVCHEWRSGRTRREWLADAPSTPPPFSCGPDTLLVAFFASAELGCYLALDWPLPARVLDLFVEFRCLTNGLPTRCGNGLIGALAHFGLDAMNAVEKDELRELAIRGGPFTETERLALLGYCESDVRATTQLLDAMVGRIDLPRALLRGRYMTAVAHMEATGTPLDAETLADLRTHWTTIKSRLTRSVNRDFNVYVPANSRPLDRSTDWGRVVFEAADAEQLDPDRLAAVADDLWRLERENARELRDALGEARRVTGLSVAKLNRWESAGRNSATWPGLDATARDLTRRFPVLGNGAGFDSDSGLDTNVGCDPTDYAGRLWELLRDPPRTRTRLELIPDAVERLRSIPDIETDGEWTFSTARFAGWLIRNGIPWPRLESGALDLAEESFRQAARRFPAVAPLHELRTTLSQLRLNELAVGRDGRNRCLLSPFRATTGRNQPSNSRFIFGPSCFLRGLIRPEPGRAVGYLDWSAQEIGIAGALSGDRAMMEAYATGDPYLWLAKQGNHVPPEATKRTHPAIRDTFKIVYLAANYGMGEQSLSQLIGQPTAQARELLRLHRERFPTFWRWSDSAVNRVMLGKPLWTVFGWRLHPGPAPKPTSLRNFPVQANGAEMLRLACCILTERGIAVCCPVHDAVLIEAPAERIEETVADAQTAMREASELVLDGFALRTDAKIVRHPDRYMDPRGADLWERVTGMLADLRATPEAVF
jgi:hypothetical protein